MEFVYDDGGRAEAGYKGTTGDCVTRAIAIATETPYQEVYDAINEMGKSERIGKRKRGKSNARLGVYKRTFRKYMDDLGWTWTPTMFVGSGCQVHLREDELPSGRLIVSLSKHSCAVIDGVIHDLDETHHAMAHAAFMDTGRGRRCDGRGTVGKLARALECGVNDLVIWDADLQDRIEDREAS